MIAKRIIPCLDIRDGRTVKGIEFINIRDAGDPVELAIRYMEEGADELVFLDITATQEKRKALSTLVIQIAKHISIPFTVGGGIRTIEDAAILVNAGADKIAVNTAAVTEPHLIEQIAHRFGAQCLVVAIDTRLEDGTWYVYLNGGRVATNVTAIDWAIEAAQRGAGEILLTSINHDGRKEGFALDITRAVANAVKIPVTASGGAGTLSHFSDVFTEGKADAALAARLFHFGEMNIQTLKAYLQSQHIPVRI
jgi:cyclase